MIFRTGGLRPMIKSGVVRVWPSGRRAGGGWWAFARPPGEMPLVRTLQKEAKNNFQQSHSLLFNQKTKHMQSTAPPILRYLKRWAAKSGDQQSLITLQEKAFNNPRLYKFLRWKYQNLPANMSHLAPFGINSPAVILPTKLPDNRIEKLLGPLRNDSPIPDNDFFQEAGSYYLAGLQQQQDLWDGPVYTADHIQISGTPQLHCRSGSYFQTLITCDILEFELLTLFGAINPTINDFAVFDKQLALRNHLHSRGNPLIEACGRHAAIGISLQIIFKHDNRYMAMLRYCSPKLAYRPRLLHAVPSLMMQPLTGDIRNEYSIQHNVYREYLEEVLQIEAEDESLSRQPFDYFYNDVNLRFLQHLLSGEAARLSPTGIAIDLLKLRPEICLMLQIDAPEWIAGHLHGHSGQFTALAPADVDLSPPKIFAGPLTRKQFSSHQPTHRLLGIALGKTPALPALLKTPANFSPPGAAALYLAINNFYSSSSLVNLA